MKKGFTLIELLVVVLIIGILAAVALPQYTKAVEKSKASQAFVALRGLYSAFSSYYLANGTYPLKFEDLDISLPHMTGSVAQYHDSHDTLSDKDWSLQINQRDSSSMGAYHTLTMTRISGDYAGGALVLPLYAVYTPIPKIMCTERKSSGKFIFAKEAGAYCKKLLQGTLVYENSYTRTYEL